jgi:tubulin polyglutamylase TTLL6/13
MLLFPAGLFRAIREREDGARDAAARLWSDKSHSRPSNAIAAPLGPQRRKHRSARAFSCAEGESACARRIEALVSKWAVADLSELRDKPADLKAPVVVGVEQTLDVPDDSMVMPSKAPACSLDVPPQGVRRAKTLYSLPPLHAIFNGQNGGLAKAGLVSDLKLKRTTAKGECDEDLAGISKPKKKLAVQINFTSHCHNVSREVVSIASNLLSWRSISSGRPDVWWLDGNSSANFALFGTLLDLSTIPPSPSATGHAAASGRQRINFFPGMCNLCHKRTLALLLERMKAFYPNEFSFSPRTYMLPEQLSEIKDELAKGTTKTFILKPDNRSLGKGIKLVRCVADIVTKEQQRYMIQRYIAKPLLIDDTKFDLRIYVLITSVEPLRVYIYDEGLARFCTQSYSAPNRANMMDVTMHLTNYALNKKSENFVYADSESEGSKRSLSSVLADLAARGHDTAAVSTSIDRMVAMTCIALLPSIWYNYRTIFPSFKVLPTASFQLLGFDVMLDCKLRPWLLEINNNPSLNLDLPIDRRIKSELIRDMFHIVDPTLVDPASAATEAEREMARAAETKFNRCFPKDNEYGLSGARARAHTRKHSHVYTGTTTSSSVARLCATTCAISTHFTQARAGRRARLCSKA